MSGTMREIGQIIDSMADDFGNEFTFDRVEYDFQVIIDQLRDARDNYRALHNVDLLLAAMVMAEDFAKEGLMRTKNGKDHYYRREQPHTGT